MKRIALVMILAVFVLSGSALAQRSYAGGSIGFFSVSGGLVSFGVQAGTRDFLAPALGVRGQMDVASIGGVTLLRFAGDLMYNIPLAGSPIGWYVGGGPGFFIGAGHDGFGIHGTLGGEMALPGLPVRFFGEIQPVYHFGLGVPVFYIRLGGNFYF